MRTSPRRLAAAVLLAAAATAADAGAQTSITRPFSFEHGDAVAVGYLTFDVTTPGTFEVSTSMSSDPMIYLFGGARPMLGATLDYNDDSWGSLNSYLSRQLDMGTYTVAVGHYWLEETEARSGLMNSNSMSGTLSVQSRDGFALETSTVPEPGTWALMGTGLAGLLGAARRRHSA
jgi:hypothetical protein